MEGGMEDPTSEVKHGWPRLGPVSERSGPVRLSMPLLGHLFELTSLAGFLQVDAGRQVMSKELLVAVQSLGSAQVLSNKTGYRSTVSMQ